MLELTTLGSVTCYAIIIAMACIIFKAFEYPLGRFLRAINPLYNHKRWESISQRMEDLELEKYEYREQNITTNKRLKRIEKKLNIKKEKKK